jgi:hypothetical protein
MRAPFLRRKDMFSRLMAITRPLPFHYKLVRSLCGNSSNNKEKEMQTKLSQMNQFWKRIKSAILLLYTIFYPDENHKEKSNGSSLPVFLPVEAATHFSKK